MKHRELYQDIYGQNALREVTTMPYIKLNFIYPMLVNLTEISQKYLQADREAFQMIYHGQINYKLTERSSGLHTGGAMLEDWT